jgi:NAD(P)-dependent dehydrogenase (short-subunit alcohol dehydrogenase family)
MQETLRYDEDVVIITGAGSGLGRAYALELARRGARIVVNDLGGSTDGHGADTAAANQVVAEIRSAGGVAVANFDSVATAAGGAAITKTALDHFGRIDAVIANAGILRDKTFARLEFADLDAVLDVHLRGAFFVLQPAFNAMRAAGRGGRLVVTTSASGMYGNFGQTNYSAAKMGLVGLMRTLALEGAKHGIQTNAISPLASTRLTTDLMLPDPNILAPEAIAPLAVLLTHPQCPANGEIFLAMGGWYARTAMFVGDGWTAKRDNTAEALLENFSAVRDLSQSIEPQDAARLTAFWHEHLNAEH